MSYEIEVKRNERGELKAETRIPIPGVQASEAKSGKPGETLLAITTSKSSGGGISSRAAVSFYGETFVVHAFGLGSGTGDYSRKVVVNPARCTEKNLRLTHAEALKHVDQILAEAKAFYAAQRPQAVPA